MIKIVIFDLDGTLLDTLDDITLSVNAALRRGSFAEVGREDVLSGVGNGAKMLIKYVLPDDVSEETINSVTDDYKRTYLKNLVHTTAPFKGITDLLSELDKRGIVSAVASNKPHESTLTLCKTFFPSIRYVYGESDKLGLRRKPFPDMVLKILSETGFRPDEAVYSGDSAVDIMTSKNTGCPCISVTWGFRSRSVLIDNGAEYLADNTADFLRFIDEINNQ